MATVNFIKCKNQNPMYLRKLLDYVRKDDKTMINGQWLVSGIDCSATDPFFDFMRTKRDFNKTNGKMFYHLDQSFHPDENLTPQQAHAIAVELAAFYRGHQVIVATHVDRGHLHSHIVVNSVSSEDGSKWHGNINEIEKLRKISDELCKQQGLTTLDEFSRKDYNGKISSREYRAAAKGESWKFTLIRAIDDALIRSTTREQFIENMEYEGITVKWLPDYKYMTYIMPDGKRCRDNKLHDEQYLKENMERLFDYREQYGFVAFTPEPSGGWAETIPSDFVSSGDILHDLARLGKDVEGIINSPSEEKHTTHEDSKVRQHEKIKKLAAGHKLRDEQEQEQKY